MPTTEKIPQTTFKEATRLEAVAGQTGVYSVDLKGDWVIGVVPHGGYLTGLLMHASGAYMAEHHPNLNQPDAISVHLEFVGKSAIGPATVHVKPVKLGRQLSVLSVSLHQQRVNITGFITHSNLAQEDGSSLSTTRWNRDTLKIPDHEKDCELNLGVDDPGLFFRPASGKIDFAYLPDSPYGRVSEGVTMQWVKWGSLEGSGEGFTVESLGFVSDMFVPLPGVHPDAGTKGPIWCPTVNLQLEVKQAPPPGGWKWLFVEVRSELIQKGRHDIRVVIRNENREVVAIGGQMGLIVSFERNVGTSKL